MAGKVQVKQCLVCNNTRILPKDYVQVLLVDGNRLKGALKNITSNNRITIEADTFTDTSSECFKRVVGNVFLIRLSDIVDISAYLR